MKLYIFFFLSIIFATSCTKLVQIDPPVNSITTSETFADSADAESALSGIYSYMSYTSLGFGDGLLTICASSSADELLPFIATGDFLNLSNNTVLAGNGYTAILWQQAYQYLYQANAIIAGLQSSASITQSAKLRFMGEAKWFRAFIDFYLVNLYGNIPLITTIDYKISAVAHQTPSTDVYQAIIADLTDAQNMLPSDYSAGGGERIRVNKWAATALLARVYLYTRDYTDAEIQAGTIINNTGMYSLDNNLNDVFLINSSEAILQWQNNSTVNVSTYNATSEGYLLVPIDSTTNPIFYLTPELLNAFETGDMRKAAWVDSSSYNGVTYYYPYKYKLGQAQAEANAPVTEYYTILRLAEQYLIRAEARAQENKLPDAINDLNVIRNRANLSNLSSSLTQTQVVNAVAQERRVELFAEWGHRWLDLKRTGQVGAVFSGIPYKSAYQSFQQLYPIPLSEITDDPNLKENPGY
jgi:hypothetical protein